MVAEVDEDNSGEIDFDEFVTVFQFLTQKLVNRFSLSDPIIMILILKMHIHNLLTLIVKIVNPTNDVLGFWLSNRFHQKQAITASVRAWQLFLRCWLHINFLLLNLFCFVV